MRCARALVRNRPPSPRGSRRRRRVKRRCCCPSTARSRRRKRPRRNRSGERSASQPGCAKRLRCSTGCGGSGCQTRRRLQDSRRSKRLRYAMTACGTKLPIRDVRFLVSIGGKPFFSNDRLRPERVVIARMESAPPVRRRARRSGIRVSVLLAKFSPIAFRRAPQRRPTGHRNQTRGMAVKSAPAGLHGRRLS
jgi:hypothetical protein